MSQVCMGERRRGRPSAGANGHHRRVGDFPAIKRGTLVAKRPCTIGKQTLPISWEDRHGGSDERTRTAPELRTSYVRTQ